LKKLRQQDVDKMEEMRKQLEKGNMKRFVNVYYRQTEETRGEMEGKGEGESEVTLEGTETW
jgi:hypothetical protein